MKWPFVSRAKYEAVCQEFIDMKNYYDKQSLTHNVQFNALNASYSDYRLRYPAEGVPFQDSIEQFQANNAAKKPAATRTAALKAKPAPAKKRKVEAKKAKKNA